MRRRRRSEERQGPSPRELFRDPVFASAVSQPSHHLLAHRTWRRGAETFVLPMAAVTVRARTICSVAINAADWPGTP